jgi:protein tyrosine/serine phosphatase
MKQNSRLSRVYTAVLLVAALASPAAARANLSQVRIDNFGQVNDNYYRGAQPEGRDYTDLAAIGVKTLVNLTSDDADPGERAMAERAGMRYFQIPMTTHQPPTAAQLTEFMRIVNDPANQPVYVHCVGGRHRTGVMTAAYRMSEEGWTADRAFKEMKDFKFGADFLHSEFKDFVYAYQPQQAVVAATAQKAASATSSVKLRQ